MKEVVLQYIWEKQLYKKHLLTTTSGAPLQIIKAGLLNREQGPDFNGAIILLNEVVFSGSIEIHLKSSDWIRHRHRYTDVILHVVLVHDLDLSDDSGYQLPVLSLETRLISSHIPTIEQVNADWNRLSCFGLLNFDHSEVTSTLLSQAGAERLQLQKQQLSLKLDDFNGDWERLAKWLLFRTAGQPQNVAPMEALFDNLPWLLLNRKQFSLNEWLILLRGVSGLWNGLTLEQETEQKSIFSYWKALFQLESLNYSTWKMGKMRPPHQPYKRLQILAQIISAQSSIAKLFNQLAVNSKSQFDHRKSNQELLGRSWGNTLMINAAIPFHALYIERLQTPGVSHLAGSIYLERLPAEDNRFSRMFVDAGFTVDNALKSQGAIHQYRTRCNPGECQHCKLSAFIRQAPFG